MRRRRLITLGAKRPPAGGSQFEGRRERGGRMGGGMGLRVGFININDMYNNDVGKGVVYVYEAYEAK